MSEGRRPKNQPNRGRGLTQNSRAGIPKRTRPNCHSKTPRSRGVGTLRDGRPADYLPLGTVGQWPLPPGNGGPCKRAASLEPTKRPRGLTHNSRAGILKRLVLTANPDQEVLSNQRGHCTQGRGPKDPSALKGRDPRTLASRRHSSLRWLSRLLLVHYGCLGRHV